MQGNHCAKSTAAEENNKAITVQTQFLCSFA